MGKDDRFSGIATDPRFRGLPAKHRKVKIDERFKGMFKDEQFKVQYKVDKRGKPLKASSNDHLKKFYDLSSEESSSAEEEEESADNDEASQEVDDSQSEYEEKVEPLNDQGAKKDKKKKRVKKKKKDKDNQSEEDEEMGINPTQDFARGLAVDSSSEESEDEEEYIPYDQKVHSDQYWGELDNDAPRVDDATNRLAVMHLDWDRTRAVDLFALLDSFKPKGGVIHSVKIYPSEFGKEKMKEDDISGPKEMKTPTVRPDEGAVAKKDAEQKKRQRENLRLYQLNRLKYYYAVVTCDSDETANNIYTQCDNMEYMATCTKLDLRFIPDDMEFDEADVHDSSTHVPTDYKPKFFANAALGQSLVQCTWDETNPDRLELLSKSYKPDQLESADLQAYLASDDDDDEVEVQVKKSTNRKKAKISEEQNSSDSEWSHGRNSEDDEGIARYRALLLGDQKDEKTEDDDDIDMEITWDTALKDTTESLLKKKQKKDDVNMTVFDKYLERKKDKKKEKQKKEKTTPDEPAEDEMAVEWPDEDEEMPGGTLAFSDDDLPGGDEEEIPAKSNKKKSKRKKRKAAINPEDDVKNADLGLLVMDSDEDNKKHFNMKEIVEYDNMTKSKRKRKLKRNELKTIEDDFKIDVEDSRFNAMYSSHLFNIDPTSQEYKKAQTKSMAAIVDEKQRRIRDNERVVKKPKLKTGNKDVPKKPEEVIPATKTNIASLVKSVKSKTQAHAKKKVRRT